MVTPYTDYYTGLLWYGDSRVLGTDQLELLESQYNIQPAECGYVSRMLELSFLQCRKNIDKTLAGTIAVPWLGEHGHNVLTCIIGALKNIGPEKGMWHLFADLDPEQHGQIISSLQQLPHCQLQSPGPQYIDALLHSKTAMVYGGYNSLTDVLAANLPAVILMRGMQDSEQQTHLHFLRNNAADQLLPIDEQQITAETTERYLREQLEKSRMATKINLQGAENAARRLTI